MKLLAEITERKRIEAELVTHRHNLEELVEARTFELKETNSKLVDEVMYRTAAESKKAALVKELESVNSELKDFAYVVSHDLKAPLRGIANLADWLQEDLGHIPTVAAGEMAVGEAPGLGFSPYATRPAA